MKYKFKHKDEHIINIIDHLNVQRIQSVMEFLDWRWIDEIPTVGKIYSELMSRLNAVIKDFENHEYDDVNDVCYSSECGGIKITIRLDEKEEPYLEVMFILTQWETSEIY
jgi:hypothetical protein